MEGLCIISRSADAAGEAFRFGSLWSYLLLILLDDKHAQARAIVDGDRFRVGERRPGSAYPGIYQTLAAI